MQDLTGGFKVFRRPVLESIDLESLASVGYAFQVETTYRAIQAGFRVVEVPIVFRDRRVGESKMTGGIVVEAAWRVPAMRLQRTLTAATRLRSAYASAPETPPSAHSTGQLLYFV